MCSHDNLDFKILSEAVRKIASKTPAFVDHRVVLGRPHNAYWFTAKKTLHYNYINLVPNFVFGA